MSDEDEQQLSSKLNSLHETNNRRLSAIKSKLNELTREKTKYNVEKLRQDKEFLQSEVGHLRHAIQDINQQINAQTQTKKNLNAQMTILRSNSGLRYSNLEIALRDKERYEKELEKPNKTEEYRNLAKKEIKLIVEALPQLEKQDDYKQHLKAAEDQQVAARNKREVFQESLNTKYRKETEIKQLLNDSTTRLPEIETAIENLRLERDQILSSTGGKKQRRRSSAVQHKPIELPARAFASLAHDTFEDEKRHYDDQLDQICSLLKYFHEKMSEHNLSSNDSPCSVPPPELMSPLYHPITSLEEQTILSSYMDEQEYENNSSLKTTTNEAKVTIAMKLPRNFTPLDLNSTTTNEIIHSPYYNKTPIEYKKELPSDIVDKYAGLGKKKNKQQHQQSHHGKKNRKNKKNFGIKHTPQMIRLYNDVRTSSGSSDTLPSMPMHEYELIPTIKALELMKQSVESYLHELTQRYQYHLSVSINEEHSEIPEDDDIRDSALDTFSETSSLIEPMNSFKDLTSVIPQLTNIPEARSSSSSDDKKTIVSSSSPPSSHHSHSKQEHQSSSTAPLTTVEELPAHLLPLTIQIAQIERQISDEGYRSVRNEKQQRHATGTNNPPLLTRSKSYDCTEKVDKWLSSTTPPLPTSVTDKNINLNNDFQATDIDNEEGEEENLVGLTISMPDD